jgi:hypothetical protein
MPESDTRTLLHHGGRAIDAQPVLELAHERDAQRRELGRADERCDVQVEVLAIARERGALDAGRLAAREPPPSGLGDRDRPAVGGVDAGADINCDLAVMGVGIALLRESLEVPVAELVGVIDDPSLAVLTSVGFPGAFADGHRWGSPSLTCTNIRKHIERSATMRNSRESDMTAT